MKLANRLAITAGLAAVALTMGWGAAQAQVTSVTLDAVKKRGQLICGIDTGIPGYAYQDTSGEWQGLDVALCRALADAILGAPNKVKFIGLTSKERFSVLKSGEIDVLIRDSEHSFTRNTS
ncbi:MAG: transporter substrate-binding domain-containing protein, partial [Methylobacteriaceae bacterium]|nr:transporter substrate-binding domain-containing protein [Methylobacteriaceae bacterium]